MTSGTTALRAGFGGFRRGGRFVTTLSLSSFSPFTTVHLFTPLAFVLAFSLAFSLTVPLSLTVLALTFTAATAAKLLANFPTKNNIVTGIDHFIISGATCTDSASTPPAGPATSITLAPGKDPCKAGSVASGRV